MSSGKIEMTYRDQILIVHVTGGAIAYKKKLTKAEEYSLPSFRLINTEKGDPLSFSLLSSLVKEKTKREAMPLPRGTAHVTGREWDRPKLMPASS